MYGPNAGISGDYLFGYGYYKRVFEAETDANGYLPVENGERVFRVKIDPETGTRLELHEEGGQLI